MSQVAELAAAALLLWHRGDRRTTRKVHIMTSTTRSSSTTTTGIRRLLLAGVSGGLAGGIVFGALMAMMGVLPMIASMVGSDSAVVGMIIHLMLSVVIGLGLTVLVGRFLLTHTLRAALTGMAYGILWWVMGPLVAMPLMFGMPLFTIDQAALLSLMGHIVYGAILGIVAAMILKPRHA